MINRTNRTINGKGVEFSTLHLAIMDDGNPALMDDRGRVITGVQSLNIDAKMHDFTKADVTLFVGQPPVAS